jgi:NADH dehydrogenase [ubiquinone] 1 alpha subcomplex assembly factor 7
VTQAERVIRDRIAEHGPITVGAYMRIAAAHYYAGRDPLGADFTTAPEISQMFGELIGLWCVVVWRAMGEPASFALVELGPGRGTLMADALRASKVAPGFLRAAQIHLVETSPTLRAKQAERLADAHPTWHARFADGPEQPTLVIANEFFDALPIEQYVGEELRRIGLDDAGRLCFVPAEGEIRETAPVREQYAAEIAERIAAHGGAALIVDYGPAESAPGDSLQAIMGNQPHPALADPGAADITAHVDFAALAAAARGAGAQIHGPVSQRSFLRRLGIEPRTAKLMEAADQATRDSLAAALDRLIAPDGMGTLFKVLALAHPALQAPPGFEP